MDFWDVFWLLVIYLPLLFMWGFALLDIFRRQDLGGGGKALWMLVVLFLPWLGTVLYLVFRPADARSQQSWLFDQPGGYTPTPAADLAVLADLHDRGKLDDAEFAAGKQQLLGAADTGQ